MTEKKEKIVKRKKIKEKAEKKEQEKIRQEKKEIKKSEKTEKKIQETKEEKSIKEKTKKEKIIKAKIKTPEELKKIREKLKKKKKILFRGRFGKRNWIRSVKDEKWQKWRVPRGIDATQHKGDTAIPRIGYGTNNVLKFRHPSGYYEQLIFNEKELLALTGKKDVAARIAGCIGKRKRMQIIKKANELKIKVLN